MKTKIGFLLLVCLLTASLPAFCQTFSISGRVLDATDSFSVIGGVVQITQKEDSNNKKGTVTDANGSFVFPNVAAGLYDLQIKYIGAQTYHKNVLVLDADVNLGNIRLAADKNVLKEAIVEGQVTKAQQTGDTTAFNAGAYKVNPDANTEDLITKMPGVTSDNTGLKVNGEAVKTVLVDGKPFFGDDPMAAIKNLPAEVIDKIQVFDKLSDQAQFTGFDDGNSSKTINIITRRGKNNGQFGKVYAGYGTDDRYSAGGNLNLFNGDRRISILALTNNINQQNFSSEDLLGVSSGNSGSGRGGFGGSGGRGGGGGGGNYGGGGSSAGNFLVGQQNGIAQTNSVGINYSDNWGKKIKVSGSYFFNNSDTKNETDLVRKYFTSVDSGLTYKENSSTDNKNTNHRASFRFEYTIDSFNSLILTPRLSYQVGDYTTNLQGNNVLGNGIQLSSVNNNNTSNNSGYNFNNNILYQHRFKKRGRTISLNVGTQLNDKTGEGNIFSLNQYPDTSSLLNQHYDLNSNGYTWSGSINYTEPIGKKSQLQANYSPSYSKNTSDKETNDFDSTSMKYTDLNPLYSNKYDNTYTTQKAGLSYRYNDKKTNFMIGANGQYATLEGAQVYPHSFNVDKNFTNILPQAMFNYKFDQSTNLRIMYRTNTNAPSISQLQDVVDISNPLLLRTGNPNLKQDFEHTITARYGKTSANKGKSFLVFAYANFAQNYIGNATYIPTNDSVFTDGLTIKRGSQLSRPINLDGYWNARTFGTLGLPLKVIKSNLNLSAGFSYSSTPAMINNTINTSKNYTPTAGIVISSNVSENLDFTLSYSGNYNVVKNTSQAASDNSYYYHNAAFKINYIAFKRLVINTNITETMYSGLGSGFNQNFYLWNAYVGYKFLKDKSLEARVSAYDILNQNKSITRNVTDTYIEDTRTQVLTQYFMFTLTYTLRKFKGMNMPTQQEGDGPRGDGPPRDRRGGGDGGGYRGGGGYGQ